MNDLSKMTGDEGSGLVDRLRRGAETKMLETRHGLLIYIQQHNGWAPSHDPGAAVCTVYTVPGKLR